MEKLPLELEARLRGPEATEEDVLAYIRHRSAAITGGGGISMAERLYWQEGDLERYRAAAAIWIKDAPPRFALPDLPTLLNGVAGPVGMHQTSFIHDLTHLWEQYAAWMASEGRDPLRPEETGRQRAARRARESMARTRERRGSDDPDRRAQLEHVRQLYDDYLAACRRRKEAVAVLDAEVRAADAAYKAAKEAAG